MGLLAGLFLVGQPVVIQKTLEIRPDVPALLFFLGALRFLLRGLLQPEDAASGRLRWFLGGGLCLGAAIMCTQKMLFVLPGALTGLGLWALAERQRLLRGRIGAVLTVLAGIAVPVAVTWAGFAVHGGGGQFVHDNFIMNAQWKMHSSRNVLVTLETSWPILVLCLVGATLAIHRFIERNPGLRICAALTLVGLIAGLLMVPAAYRQYYLMPLPIACVFAAKGLPIW